MCTVAYCQYNSSKELWWILVVTGTCSRLVACFFSWQFLHSPTSSKFLLEQQPNETLLQAPLWKRSEVIYCLSTTMRRALVTTWGQSGDSARGHCYVSNTTQLSNGIKRNTSCLPDICARAVAASQQAAVHVPTCRVGVKTKNLLESRPDFLIAS